MTSSEANPVVRWERAPQEAQRWVIRRPGAQPVALHERSLQLFGLEPGQALDAAAAARLEQAQAYEEALRQAARWIDQRPRSQQQVRDKLQAAGVEAVLVTQVLTRLVELGLLDDRALGRALMEEIQRKGGGGPLELRAKLAQRGLEEALIDELLASHAADAEAQWEQALAVGRKQSQRMGRLEPGVQRRRLYAALARRGFEEPVILRVVEHLLGPEID